MNRYQYTSITKIDKKQVYQTTLYPEIPLSDNDTYVYTTQGDRFDILANQYYNDKSLWWIISIANTATAGTSLPSDLPQDSLIIPEGLQIRIPANYVTVLNSYKQLNNF
jgi:phage tail protein X